LVVVVVVVVVVGEQCSLGMVGVEERLQWASAEQAVAKRIELEQENPSQKLGCP
jgi:hypothetical protein